MTAIVAKWVCVYVYMCVGVCVCVRASERAIVCARVRAYMRACVHACFRLCLCVFLRVCMCTCVRAMSGFWTLQVRVSLSVFRVFLGMFRILSDTHGQLLEVCTFLHV